MQTFAHIENGVVREVLSIPDGHVLGKDLFSPEMAKDCVECSGTVTEGMVYDAKSETFSAPPAPPVVVPASVTKVQAKIQLRRTAGSAEGKTLLDDVVAAIKEDGGELEIWFDDAQNWERQNPYVHQLGSALKLSDEQVDNLFIAAAKISA